MKKIAIAVVLLFVFTALPLLAQTQPAAAYYVNVNGQSFGPYRMSDLTQFINQGRVTRNSLVWRAGMTHWMEAGTLVELAVLFSAPPHAAPPLFTAPPAAPLVITPAPAPSGQSICTSFYTGGTCNCYHQAWGNPLVWNNPFLFWY